MTATHEHDATTPHAEEHAHPDAREYVKVAVILAFVTALEIALFYIQGLSDFVVITALMILMAIKFAMVGLWFMHLKFDNPVFRRLFVTGLILAMAVFGIVLTTFGVFAGE